jgi:predicted GNAT family acetyltransferase
MRGVERVFLVTDLANPTSNAIYARVGYEPLEDDVELRFVGA